MTRRTGRAVIGVLLVLASLLVIAAPAAVAQDKAAIVVFQVSLSGGETGDPDGRGEAVLRFNRETGTLCYVIVVRGIGAPTEPAQGLGSAHIHGPLPGTGIAVDLEAEFVQSGHSDVFVAHACVSVDPMTLEAILAHPSLFYVNVHTAEYPGGAVTGTLA